MCANPYVLFFEKNKIIPHIFLHYVVKHYERRVFMTLELKEQYEKIYTYCYFKVKNREIAEDITQETFLKYFQTNSYMEKGKKLAFLYTIARNLCFDHFKKAKVTENIDDLLEVLDVSENKVDTNIVVRAAVQKLSEEEQEMILLRFTNELGISEIAQYFDISRFRVYRKINATLKKLKQDLKEEDFYGGY